MSGQSAEQQDYDDWSSVLDEESMDVAPSSGAEHLSLVEDESQASQVRSLALSGKLENMPIPDLAQTLEGNRKTGMLEVVTESRQGRVAFMDGAVVGAWVDRLVGASALYRLLGCTKGDFSFYSQEVQPPQTPAEQPGLPSAVQGLLMEGMRHIDEVERLQAELPGEDVVLALPAAPQGDEIFRLSEAALLLFTSISTDATYAELTVNSELCDLELAQSLRDLLSGGFLIALDRERVRPKIALVPEVHDQGELGLSEDYSDDLELRSRGGAGKVVAVSGVIVGLAAVGWGAFGDEIRARTGVSIPAVAGVEPAQGESGHVGETGDAQAEQMDAIAPAALRPTCPVGMQLVTGGKFFRGSQSEERIFANATPSHRVQLDTYCLDTFEVTVEQYRECSNGGDCERAHRQVWWPRPASKTVAQWKQDRRALAEHCNENHDSRVKHPVNCVTWSQAKSYCEYRDTRLPTEAEWEFAARGADGRVYPWGDHEPSAKHLNGCGLECQRRREEDGLAEITPMYPGDDGYATTAPVGSFPKGVGQWGHQDLIGNVFEWTADAYLPYSKLPELQDGTGEVLINPVVKKGDRRVIRGGAFNSYFAEFTNPALRGKMPADTRTHGIGFRCASDPIYK